MLLFFVFVFVLVIVIVSVSVGATVSINVSVIVIAILANLFTRGHAGASSIARYAHAARAIRACLERLLELPSATAVLAKKC